MVRYTTGATSGGETAYPAGAPELTPAIRVLLDLLVFCVVFCRSLFVLFLLVIVLSVLRFTYSDYSFDIFKILYVNMCFAFAVDCVREIPKSWRDVRVIWEIWIQTEGKRSTSTHTKVQPIKWTKAWTARILMKTEFDIKSTERVILSCPITVLIPKAN
jgi:hypothetical protein